MLCDILHYKYLKNILFSILQSKTPKSLALLGWGDGLLGKTAQPSDLNLISQTQEVDGDNQFLQLVLCPPYICVVMYTYTCTNKALKINNIWTVPQIYMPSLHRGLAKSLYCTSVVIQAADVSEHYQRLLSFLVIIEI